MSSIKYTFGLICALLLANKNLVLSENDSFRCNSCSGDECRNSLGEEQLCQVSDIQSQTCVTVFGNDTDNTVIGRGCSNGIALELVNYCASNSNKCIQCSSSGCNLAHSLNDFVECVSCDSKTDRNCILNPNAITSTRLCHKSCMAALYVRNEKDAKPIYELLRSCLDDKNWDAMKLCSDDGDEFCTACTEGKCNVAKFPKTRLKCYTCKSDKCEDQTSEECVSYAADDKCYRLFDESNNIVKLGCRSEFEEEDLVAQIKDKKLLICDGAECNSFVTNPQPNKCYKCDSATNENCAVEPNALTDSEICNTPYTQCYTKISDTNGGVTVRGCLSELSADEFYQCLLNGDEKCQSCSETECNNLILTNAGRDSDNDNCLTCSGIECDERCNRDLITETRLSCWRCFGEDCARPAKSKCPIYHEEDRCFILFEQDSSNFAQMGCASEYDSSTFAALHNQVLYCDSDNCNSLEKIPEAPICLVCDSASDPLCATNPSSLKSFKQCSSRPCFTRIEKGLTKRGCLEDLRASTIDDCMMKGDDANCNVCDTEHCNIEVYPANRRSCHHCSSENDNNCQTSPKNTRICALYQENDECVVELSADTTKRGCYSDFQCNRKDRDTCRICATDDCNIFDLFSNFVGSSGIWQDLPLKCYQCDGEACKSSPGEGKLCSGNNLQNCMTVFNSDGVVVQRGCSDSVIDTHWNFCENNPDKCYGCNSNECNRAMSLNDYIECVSCDTGSDGACLLSPSSISRTRKCYKSCMVVLFPRSEEMDPAYDTARSCLDDKDLSDRATCQTGSEAICKACDKDKCNIDNLPADRRSCFHCSGDGCQLPTKEFCVGYRANDQCFFMFDENQKLVESGCRSDFTISQSDELVLAKRLLLCNGDDCNDLNALPPRQSCVLCNSKTDVGCAVDAAAVTSSTTCGAPYTQCYTRVLNDGATERGCLSNLAGNDFNDCLTGNSTTCITCTGHKCNNHLFPPNRMSCHVCDSSTNVNCERIPNSLSACAKLDANETCVTSFNDGTTFRACGTDLQCDTSNRKNCRVCSYNGCNTVDLAAKHDNNFGKWQDLPLSCFECSGANCQGQPSVATECEEDNNQDCSTVFNTEGSVIRRGCSHPVDIAFEDYCDANPGHCFNCKSNKCNIANELSDFKNCVACDSHNDKTCVTEPTSVSLRSRQCQGGCMVALYLSVSSSNQSYELIRTCINDKELTDQAKCSAGSAAFCKHCTGPKCNTYDLPENRRRCHTCLGESCNNPISEKCQLHEKDDQCFVEYDSSNNLAMMGCLSDFHNQQIIDIIQTKRVYLCNGDDCNAIDKIPTEKHCVACDSATDINCAISPGNVATIGICTLLPYSNCYTKISNDGRTLRGCLTDLEADEFTTCLLSGGVDCTHCVGHRCNKEIFPENRLQCNSCNSETDTDCKKAPTILSPCPFIDDKCVSALIGNTVHRGCTSQVHCHSSDINHCSVCNTYACNTIQLDNGAFSIIANNLLLAMLVTVVSIALNISLF